MKHNYTKLLVGALVAVSVAILSVDIHAEQGVVVISKDGTQKEVPLAHVHRIDIGDSGITLHHKAGNPSEVAYENLDRLLIGAELSGIKEIVADGSMAVWPTRVTSDINVTGATNGAPIKVYSTSGALVASSTVGADSSATIDMSGVASGVYIITVGTHSVKFIKE